MTISPVLTTSTVAAPPASGKVRDAAQQFEALLLGQMLRSQRESGSGWLGSGEDSSAECVTDYAEQQFAAIMAQNGGLGIATMVASGLEPARTPAAAKPEAGGSVPAR